MLPAGSRAPTSQSCCTPSTRSRACWRPRPARRRHTPSCSPRWGRRWRGTSAPSGCPSSTTCCEVATWPAGRQFAAESRALTLRPGEGLPGRVWAAGAPAWLTDVPPDTTLPRAQAAARAGLLTAFGFPVRGAAGIIGVIEFFTATRRAADEALLATMGSLGLQIGQFVERCRAQEAVRDADARKSAILNAAFDCVVTMDHRGHIVEVNKATERTFGYSRRGDDRAGAGRADDPAGSAGRAPQGADPLHRHRPVADDQPPGRAARDAQGRLRVPGRARGHAPRAARAAAVLRLHARRHRAPQGRGGAAPAGRRAGRAAAGRDRRRRRDGAGGPVRRS